jgi:hypothetical protein
LRRETIMAKDVLLIIGDLHAPAYHQDTVRFLAAVQRKYAPTRIVLTGDEINWESISYHEKNPDLPAAEDERREAVKALKPIYQMFPKADILESNHGSLVYRKARTAGLPSFAVKSYNEVIEAPKRLEMAL